MESLSPKKYLVEGSGDFLRNPGFAYTNGRKLG